MKLDDILDTVICADCMDILPQLPDNCVDLVLTDPPYGIKYARGKHGWGVCDNRPTLSDVSWDKKPTPKHFEEIQRISKNQIIFGGNYFTNILPVSKGWIFWDKIAETNNKSVFADGELAWTSYNKVIKKYVFRVMGFINDSQDIRQHPTQKPSELMRLIIEDYTNKGDVILDCFCGSGSTLVACEDLQRHYIGIEISPEYCEIARKRIEQEKSKYALFQEAI